jgi:ABC-type bacteriocin/lantibiotic exporter with double-glycine peptidase domain
MTTRPPRRRLRVPIALQASATDCGPAALAALLAGWRIDRTFSELRDACQVGIEGTSIDVLEAAARRLGLDARQVMVPADHVLLPAARCLPAIAVTRLESGATHFLLLWRRWGRWVEIMDPAGGRRWLSWRALENQLYIHRLAVPATAWESWARTADFLEPLTARARALGFQPHGLQPLFATATRGPSWRQLAALDAALRRTAGLVRAGVLHRGSETRAFALAFLDLYLAPLPSGVVGKGTSPWTVVAAPSADLLEFRGALLVRVRGSLPPEEPPDAAPSPLHLPRDRTLRRRAATALRRRRARWHEHPLAFLAGLLPVRRAAFLAVAAVPLAAAALLEPLLLTLVISNAAGTAGTAAAPAPGIVALLLTFEAALLALEAATAAALRSLGRVLETRLRLALDRSLPGLPDAFVRTRLAADLAERVHALHRLRRLPLLAFALLRDTLELALYAASLASLAPRRAPLLALLVLLLAALPLLLQPTFRRLDRRLRQRAAALAAAWLDLLRGAATVRACAAEPQLAQLLETRLAARDRARRGQARAQLRLDLALQLLAAALAAALFLGTAAALDALDAPTAFLAAYWIFAALALGPRLATHLSLHLPAALNLAARLREPLEEAAAHRAAQQGTEPSPAASSNPPAARRDSAPAAAEIPEPRIVPAPPRGPARRRPSRSLPAAPHGLAITFDAVRVEAEGHLLLDALDLDIPPGAHLALVGSSGAGKSSLLATLLGWYPPTAGTLRLDGAPWTPAAAALLRRHIAWVDPTLQIWHRSLLENLTCATDPGRPPNLAAVLRQANLIPLLERLPHGLATPLRDPQTLGADADRLRLARALLRPAARLVLLDEPCRSLGPDERRHLLARARATWRRATLLCVTHDLDAALTFPRVLVLAAGRIVEDGHPRHLAARPGTHLRTLFAARAAADATLRTAPGWRRLHLENGRLTEIRRRRQP